MIVAIPATPSPHFWRMAPLVTFLEDKGAQTCQPNGAADDCFIIPVQACIYDEGDHSGGRHPDVTEYYGHFDIYVRARRFLMLVCTETAGPLGRVSISPFGRCFQSTMSWRQFAKRAGRLQTLAL